MNKKTRQLILFAIIPVGVFLAALIIALLDIIALKERAFEVNLLIIIGAIILDAFILIIVNWIDLRFFS